MPPLRTSSVTMHKLHKLSVPLFPPVWNESNKSSNLGLYQFVRMICVKAWCLLSTHLKDSILIATAIVIMITPSVLGKIT